MLEQLWYGDGGSLAPARAALWPLSRVYAAAMAARRRLYDAGVLGTLIPALPVISVGNLTVGGTGKTPFAAWLASHLAGRARPAIALRGYGSDEAAVHTRLNPGVPVIVNADRAAAVLEAQRRNAEVVILDDAFQHRRIGRTADVVLLSVEQLLRPRRVLPAGPWREDLTAARRADLLVLTRKSASDADVAEGLRLLSDAIPDVPVTVVRLAPSVLVDAADGMTAPLEQLRGAQVLAIAAIGEPEAFRLQLEQLGARVVLAAYRDHHDFTDAEIRALAARAPAKGLALCTLKDAVKLARRWPGPGQLWYVSQHLVVERGAAELDGLLERVLAARTRATITAG